MLDLYKVGTDFVYKITLEVIFIFFFLWTWKHVYMGWLEQF